MHRTPHHLVLPHRVPHHLVLPHRVPYHLALPRRAPHHLAPPRRAPRRFAPSCGLALAGALLLHFSPAHAGDPPKLKEGLWEVHVQTEEKPSGAKNDVTYQLCRDHAYDKTADELLKNLPGCTTVIKDVGKGQFSSASNCVVNGTTVVSSGVTVFTSKTATHSETNAKYLPPFKGKTEETMIQDQQYVGSCPNGTRPGDTISADGFIRHHS